MSGSVYQEKVIVNLAIMLQCRGLIHGHEGGLELSWTKSAVRSQFESLYYCLTSII